MDGRTRLNLLMLIIDDLRTDLGSYGRKWARTPAIDALSKSSVTFLQAHASVANCAPSRASLLTGLRPDSHGVYDLQTHVRARHKRLKTLPQVFREHGYLTVSYGKIFHQFLDDSPSWSGQDEWADNHTYRGLTGRAWSRAGGWTHGWRYNQYMTAPNVARQETTRRRRHGGDKVSVNGLVPPFEVGPDRPSSPYTDEHLGTLAVRALRRLHVAARPWLLAVGFIRPHLPFNVPARYWDGAEAAARHAPTGTEARAPAGLSELSASHVRAGDGELFDFALRPEMRIRRRLKPGSPEGLDLVRAYAAAVSFVDAQVGRVLAALGTAARETSLIVLLSDHGYKLGHHGGWGKHTLLAADTHVPLLVAAPGVSPKRVQAPVELIDVFPTVLQLCGLPVPGTGGGASGAAAEGSGGGASGAGEPPPLEGRSLVPLMRRRAPKRRIASALAFSQWPVSEPERCMGYAVRTQVVAIDRHLMAT
jgi:iduronate 2-sulfatase